VVRHLIADFPRRAARVYLGCGLLTALVWIAVGAAGDRAAPAGILLSMVFAFVAGPVLALGMLAPREVCLLPIPRRTLWQAQWTAGVVGATAWLAAAKLAGVAVAFVMTPPPRLDLELVALSSLYDVAYMGVFFAIVLLVQVRASGRVLYLLVVGAFIGGIVWPFLLQSSLPMTWEGLRGTGGILVSAGVLAAILSYFHEPAIGPRAAIGRFPARRTRGPSRVAAPVAGGPNGVTLLLMHRAAVPFGSVAGFHAALIVLIVVVSLAQGDDPMLALSSILRGYERHSLPIGEAWSFLGWVRDGWFVPLIVSGFGSLTPMARHLRALPIAAWRVTLCLIAAALPAWVGFGMVMSVLGLALNGRIPAWPVDVLVLFVGITALAHAIQWAFGLAWGRLSGMPLVVLILVSGVLHLMPAPVQALVQPLWVGAAALLAAAVIHRLSLLRANYRPSDPALSPVA
jgi:hypothetical protein